MEGLSCTDCLDPYVYTLTDQDYTVWVWNEEGCPDSLTIYVRVDLDYNIFFPNVFTPNGDGDNDMWTGYGTENVKEIENVKIFDRWGELVFETNNIPLNEPGFGWDGTFRGQMMQPAVFVYVAHVRFIDDSVRKFVGDITLIR